MTLKYEIKNQVLHPVGRIPPTVELSRNVVFLELSFDAEWSGAAVTVLFSNDFVENGKTYQKIWNNETVPVPTEVLETGMLRIGCVGLLDGGETRITTARMERGVQILQCGGIIGVDPAGQTPELWEQLLASMGQLGDLQTEDKSSLVAAINEVLSKAGGGSGSVDPADIAKAVEDYLSANPIQEQDPTVPAWAKAPEKPTYTAEEVHALPDTYTPPVDAALSENSKNPVQNKIVTAKLSEVEAIAKGRSTGHVFDTVEAMQEWIADHADALNLGDNLYIRATDVPDYWWDGTAAQPLETTKVDLTEYAKKSEVPVIDSTVTKSGQAADAAAVREELNSLSEEIAAIPSGKDGADGQDGITPTIGDNGNWYLGNTDTGKPSRGEPGQDGSPGAAGADGYTPVKGTDYFTDADKQEIADTAAGMVSIPDKLPNPNALTFTGAVNETYDGSEAKTVTIPSGGGSGETFSRSKEILAEGTIAAGTAIYSYTDTGLNFDDILDAWEIFYVEIYSTEKNRFRIHGHKSNDGPIIILDDTCYATACFASVGKAAKSAIVYKYIAGGTGQYWGIYCAGADQAKQVIDHAVSVNIHVYDLANCNGIFIRNYGAATTVDVQWRIVGLIKRMG